MRLTGEKGFTYIELVIALAIAVLVGGAASSATFQVLKNSECQGNHMTAVRQVQNAGYWIAHDTRMAQSISTDNLTPPDFLALSWTAGDEYQVVYTLEDMPDGAFKKINREQSINGIPDATTFIAQHIDPAVTDCAFAAGKLSLTVKATVGGGAARQSEARTYKFVPRPG